MSPVWPCLAMWGCRKTWSGPKGKGQWRRRNRNPGVGNYKLLKTTWIFMKVQVFKIFHIIWFHFCRFCGAMGQCWSMCSHVWQNARMLNKAIMKKSFLSYVEKLSQANKMNDGQIWDSKYTCWKKSWVPIFHSMGNIINPMCPSVELHKMFCDHWPMWRNFSDTRNSKALILSSTFQWVEIFFLYIKCFWIDLALKII